LDGREIEYTRLRAVLGPGGQVLCWVPEVPEAFPTLSDGAYGMTELGTLRWVPKIRRQTNGWLT